MEQLEELLQSPQYDFLRTNKHLKNKIILLTLGGSYSYGTNTEDSDIDVRGCALPCKSDLLGFTKFEQVEDRATDTVIYEFNKLVGLLVDCNPNVIEMLGCKPEHYLYLTDIGQMLIDNRKMFLSKRAFYSFGGYATQQLRRLENALARDRVTQEKKEEHILKSMKTAAEKFDDRFGAFKNGSIKLYIDDTQIKEIVCDFHIDRYPVREFNRVVNMLSNVAKLYDRLNHRNSKKDDKHLNKHAMHLIRLYLMCFDILERGEIVTYRENDLGLLMDIRNGGYQNKDGTYRSEFFEMIDDFEKRLEYAKTNTDLPDEPDMKRIEEFVMDVNRRAIDAENRDAV